MTIVPWALARASECGKAAAHGEIWLSYVYATPADEIAETISGELGLSPSHGNGVLHSDPTVSLPILGNNRFLKEEDAVWLHETTHPDGGGSRVSVVGIHHDPDVGSKRLTNDSQALRVGSNVEEANLHLDEIKAGITVAGGLGFSSTRLSNFSG
jgi:hypothetical protein